MASTKLTNQLRERIHVVLMDRAYVERRVELQERENALALAVYNHAYDKETQAKMAALSENFFPQCNAIAAEFNECFHVCELPDPKPVSYDYGRHYRRCLAQFDGDHPLTHEYEQWKKESDQLDEDINKLAAEARAILSSCGTVKRLCEIWPEVCPLLNELGISIEQKKCLLPAVRKDMNQLFKLPPDAFAEAAA